MNRPISRRFIITPSFFITQFNPTPNGTSVRALGVRRYLATKNDTTPIICIEKSVRLLVTATSLLRHRAYMHQAPHHHHHHHYHHTRFQHRAAKMVDMNETSCHENATPHCFSVGHAQSADRRCRYSPVIARPIQNRRPRWDPHPRQSFE
jgi:hypothetical protein